jgi:hypothetical protein
MKNGFKYPLCLALGLFFTGVVGCSDTVDEITNSVDCHTVCKRYADCFNADYDVDGCSDKCESRAGNDDDKQRALRACDACIDDRSCTSATFNCADDCVGIVP